MDAPSPTLNHDGRSAVATAVLILAASVVLIVNAVHYLPFIADDSLISLRYVDRLLAGHGLTWTEGRPVEGYSNLLWILLTAGLGAVGMNLITATRVLGFACTLLGLGVIGYAYRRYFHYNWIATGTGLLFMALAGPIAVWAIGGMEQPLVLLLLVLGLLLTFRATEEPKASARLTWWASVPLALLCITRPDGFLFTATVALGLLLSDRFSRSSWRQAGELVVLPITFVVGQQVFRLVYYGEWLPNPAYVKISGSGEHFVGGLAYLGNGFVAMLPIAVPALALTVLAMMRWRQLSAGVRRRYVILIISLVAWMGYIAFVGGDIFPAWRHFVPIILLVALLLIEGLAMLWGMLKDRSTRATVGVALAVLLALFAYLQLTDSENRRAISERWEWDGQVVGLMLKNGFDEQKPLLACTAAGCLPYWSELPSVDMLGLNDYHIARAHPADFGTGRLAHELGDGAYVLGRKPDLVVFCGPRGGLRPCYRSGQEMAQLPEFRREYTPVKFQGLEPYRFGSIIWVRRFSERIGIQSSDSLITVPSYLINGHRETFTRLDTTDTFVIEISSRRPGVLLQLPVPGGRWQLEIDPPVAAQALVRSAPGSAPMAQGGLPLVVDLPDADTLSFWLYAESPTDIKALSLRKTIE
jgi:hypothetical protein